MIWVTIVPGKILNWVQIGKKKLQNRESKEPVTKFDDDREAYDSWANLLADQIQTAKLTGLQKLSVLKLHTTGAAKEIVNNYSFLIPEHAAEDTYTQIWAALKERFGNAGQTAHLLINKIESFPSVSSSEDWDSIGKLRLLCHSILNSLKYSADHLHIGLDRFYSG